MKKILNSLIIVVLVVASIVVTITIASGQSAFYNGEAELTQVEIDDAFDRLYTSLNDSRYTYFEYLDENAISYNNQSVEAEINEPIELAYEAFANLNVDVPETGYYELHLVYDMSEEVLNNATLSVDINGERPFYEASILDLPITWQDKSKVFEVDSYGDQALPAQVKAQGPYTTALYNNTYYTSEPTLFYLEEGNQELTISNQSSSVVYIQGMRLQQPEEVVAYSVYKDEQMDKKGEGVITVNAIEYISKNSSYVRLASVDTPTAQPFDPVDKKLNIIAGPSWRNPGRQISYEVTVPKDGFYKLAIHYMPHKEDFEVFRTIRIDGQVPFAEVSAYGFEYIANNKALYETLSDDEGQAYEFYLTEGSHEVSLTATYEPISEQVRRLQLIIDHINQFALDIRKITGKEVDKNRTWRITEYVPETEAYLNAYDVLIKSVLDETSAYASNGYSSSTLSYLQKALVKLDKILEKPDELPLHFEDLYSGSGSVNQMLGDSMEALNLQPMSLNEMTFYGDDFNGKANASFIETSLASFQKFMASFTSDKYVVNNDDSVLNVWVNRPITHVDTLQKMVDSDFTLKTGIPVKISVMPDANKLVLASAAGEAPDVAMGLLSYMPFDLAIRDAAYDLTQFDDFWTVADRFTPGAFVPYVLEDKVYALPETLEFFTTVYRKDIFRSLGFEVPDTWQDVTELLPELQRYGMNFYHPIAGGGSLKWFYQTSPFIYQNGGSLYSEDGLEATIDETNSVKGLEYLGKLFTMYSLPAQEPLFYNAFRYGTLPVGIADFTTYMQIKNAAPELIGQWALAPYPGVEDANGNINRWIIANGRGSVIMGGTKRADEAWEFLKWWTDEETQTTYSYTLQSIYGPEYLWLSSNLDAVKNSPIDIEDKEVILEQIKWLRDVPRTPGQYMLERGISDIWNKTVFDNVPTRIAIDQQVITINREIKRKMIEFGYLDENGEVLVPYPVRDIDWIIEQIESKGGQNDEATD